MKKLDISVLVDLYTNQHLTCSEIGDMFGASRQAVHQQLKKAGVTREQGTKVQVICGYCGEPKLVRRSQFKNGKAFFCNRECFFAHLEGGTHKPWKYEQRASRAIVAKHFKLSSDHVIDYLDKDNKNNNLHNLVVYRSEDDRVKANQGQKVLPIWKMTN